MVILLLIMLRDMIMYLLRYGLERRGRANICRCHLQHEARCLQPLMWLAVAAGGDMHRAGVH